MPNPSTLAELEESILVLMSKSAENIAEIAKLREENDRLLAIIRKRNEQLTRLHSSLTLWRKV